MQIEAVLGYLQEDLDLKGDDLKKVVKSFPEVINCDVERRLKANVEHMQKVRSNCSAFNGQGNMTHLICPRFKPNQSYRFPYFSSPFDTVIFTCRHIT